MSIKKKRVLKTPKNNKEKFKKTYFNNFRTIYRLTNQKLREKKIATLEKGSVINKTTPSSLKEHNKRPRI